MKSIFRLLVAFTILLQMHAARLTAQDSARLTLEDIYSKRIYTQKGFGPIRWMKDNKGYSTLEINKEVGGRDIIRYDVKTGTRTVLVSAAKLIPPGGSEPLVIADYGWSDDNRRLLVFTDTRRVWRYNTRGDYWTLDAVSGKLQQLGKSVERSTMMFAKFSPDASRVAYVSRNNIYVENIKTGNITKITHDGNESRINGTFDWVYEEELDCRDGFRWSPDGNFIAYWQSETSGVGTFYLINNVDSLYSKPVPLPYPKVGTTLSAVKIGVIGATGGQTSWLNIPGDPRNNYLARMDFVPNSDELMIQQLNRRQNINSIWIAGARSHEIKNILTETDEAFLDVHDNIQWLDHEKYFTWTSEKDGWLHLYKVSRDGKNIRLITKGKFDVVNINCIAPNEGYVYYTASPDNFTERYLYRSRLDGLGIAERVTPANMKGQHSYQISPDAQWAIHTFQNAVTPPRINAISLRKHAQLRLLEGNEELKGRYERLHLRAKEFFRVDIGDIALDAWMIRPAQFDSTRKTPVLFFVYGEPAGATVQNNWDGGEGLWHQYLAQQGYVIISIDNRGTKTPRGRDWRKSIYRQIGILAAHDQAKAAAKIFSMFDFIDTARVGIWGWSGGGQMTLNCMFRYPGTYKTGIAVSFVSDQRLYDATYQERYMGLIETNREGYRDGSPITHAAGLAGKLMIIHGTADDNVHYQSFEMLANELIKNNKIFSMMSYPMRSHGINERENTSLHLRKTMAAFWKANL